MQGLPVVVYQDEDLETAAAGVVLVAQDGQLVAAHRHADRLRGDPVAALRGPVAHVVAQINLRRAPFPGGGQQALRHHGRLLALPATVEGQRRRLAIAPLGTETAHDIRYLPLAEGIRLGHPLGSQDQLALQAPHAARETLAIQGIYQRIAGEIGVATLRAAGMQPQRSEIAVESRGIAQVAPGCQHVRAVGKVGR